MSASNRHDLKANFLAQRGALHPHPEQVQDDLFQSVEFFDARDLIQVRYEMVRRYRTDRQGPTQVACAFGVSRQHLHGLARTFQNLGLPGLFPRQPGPKAARKCTDEVLAFVRACQARSPQLTLDDLLAEVWRCLGVRLHRRTLQRQLTRQEKKLHRSTRPAEKPVSHISI